MTAHTGRRKLTEKQIAILHWLGREESGLYGACKGGDLDALIELGLAQIRETHASLNLFLPPHSEAYRTVSLTEAGRTALAEDGVKQ